MSPNGLQRLGAVGEDVQQGLVCHEIEPWEGLLLLLQVPHAGLQKFRSKGNNCGALAAKKNKGPQVQIFLLRLQQHDLLLIYGAPI